MLLAAKLLFSGALDAVLRGLSAALKWLVSDWRNAPLVVCAAMWAANALLIVPARDRQIAALDADVAAEQAAHLGTVNAFFAASRQAQKDAEANAQRVARQQETITDDIVTAYRFDLADLRSRFDRLRRGSAARTDPGHADAAGLPGLPAAAGGIDAASGENRFPAPGKLTEPPLSLPDALLASEQALQLQALIDWVGAQSAVRFAPAEPAQ
jgi:enoyl-CoA hydratase/carnithine racemase